MVVGIDASNIRVGGGINHLVELLRASDPVAQGFSKVIVWSRQATLDRIEGRSWLVKAHQPLLEKSLPYRAFWQRFRLSRLARLAGCDVLFVPGGSYAGDFRPIVSMSQNLLPFEWRELRRWGWSWLTLKHVVLRIAQARAFRRADGLIFLTRYARDVVIRIISSTAGKTTIIPHGLDGRFLQPPRQQSAIDQYSVDRPFRVVYVSIIDVYKHQWHVAEAVAQLRKSGIPIVLTLVGSPTYPPSVKRLRDTQERFDRAGEFIHYVGPLPHAVLRERYEEEDVCLFASSCENLPNILVEGMASGLPVACSNRGPMPEVLGDAGVYFDPENAEDIACALRELIDSPALRTRLAKASFERALAYSWRRCAEETFGFLAGVVADFKP